MLWSFVAREGHAQVPARHEEAGFRLGAWVARQRHDHNRGRLPAEAIEALERIPGWTWNALERQGEDRFEKALCLLRQFVEREGHARVPTAHVEEGFPLRRWAGGLRAEWKRGSLEPERVQALESVPGWSWGLDVNREQRFEEGLRYLRAFVEREGHARVTAGHVERGFRLGGWVRRQRQDYRNGKLPLPWVVQLAAVPGWSWNRLADRFEEGLRYLRAFAEREGHARVTAGHVEQGFSLGWWVSKRRVAYAAGRLSRERVQALERVPGWLWDARDNRFEKALRLLRQFVEREGHARVPVRHPEEGFLLGRWAGGLRAEWKRGSLEPERVRALESVPGWSWSPREGKSEECFQRGLRYLRAFAQREGHARMLAGHVEQGFRLSAWVSRQRQDYRNGKLPLPWVVQLAAVPGWSWNLFVHRFEEGLRYLRAFVEREGHARVPAGHVEQGFRLGEWVSKRRPAYARSRLSPERVRALQSVPGWSWAGEARKRGESVRSAASGSGSGSRTLVTPTGGKT